MKYNTMYLCERKIEELEERKKELLYELENIQEELDEANSYFNSNCEEEKL